MAEIPERRKSQSRASALVVEEGSNVPLANPTYTREPFVDFRTVGPETNLEELNLNWREKDLPERERTKHVHRLHPYLGKFIPQLVEIFLRKFQPGLVCDPFAGSGTTLVEAATLGIDFFGVDLSPFNCLLSKVKTENYDTKRLRHDVFDILRRSRSGESSLFPTPQTPSRRELEPTGYISEWFAPQAQRDLLSYCSLIPDYEYQDLLKIIMSRAARSARLVPHHELDFPKAPQRGPYQCRKHGRICRPVEEARKFLDRYSADTVRRITEFMPLRKRVLGTVICGDSREIEFPPADLLLTSPPYVGLIDYHEQHRYAYELLSLLPEPFASVGYREPDGCRREKQEIGPAAKGNSRQAIADYAEGISAVFANAIDPMPSGSHIVVVVNDKRGLYSNIAEALPLEQLTVLNRHVNRRTGRRNGAFYEQVLIWRKL